MTPVSNLKDQKGNGFGCCKSVRETTSRTDNEQEQRKVGQTRSDNKLNLQMFTGTTLPSKRVNAQPLTFKSSVS